jgi:hypothetical protein
LHNNWGNKHKANREVVGHKVVHIVVQVVVHMDYVVAGHIGLAAVVDKVDVVMIAVHKVVEREADHIDFVVVRNKEIEGTEKTFVQVVAVPACCILTVPEGKVMMVPVKLERMATEVVLVIQDVEE